MGFAYQKIITKQHGLLNLFWSSELQDLKEHEVGEHWGMIKGVLNNTKLV